MWELLLGPTLLLLAIGFLLIGGSRPPAKRFQATVSVTLDSPDQEVSWLCDHFFAHSRLLSERGARSWFDQRVNSLFRILETGSAAVTGAGRLVCRFNLLTSDGDLVDRLEIVHPVPPRGLTPEATLEALHHLAEVLL